MSGMAMILTVACGGPEASEVVETPIEAAEFQWQTEQFADLKILRYEVPGFDQLDLKQKELVYYLTQAGLSGRDIIYDQNHRFNLSIRRALEGVFAEYHGDKGSSEWTAFEVYAKRFWFSNGIHHHYSNQKLEPEFSREYFSSLLKATNQTLSDEIMEVIFDPSIDAKKVSKDSKSDMILASAVNFYDPDITQAEVEAFYAAMIDKKDAKPISYGLNSKLVRMPDGTIQEKVWKLGGMYSESIERIVFWLEKASTVSENEAQKKALDLLIDYYKTGDLRTWDTYNVAWVEATEGDIDYINSFIEVYNDPLGYRGNYESVVQIKDFDASARMKVVSDNIQWFEDESPIMNEHKKENVVGVSYKMVNVAGESGDAAPSTPIGVNLPNANWIRTNHGSKSVSLANIEHAYDKSGGSGFLQEFAFSTEERERAEKYGDLASKLHTALHEVVGHASGKLNKGVGTPKESLKNYASTLEEARADLVALYFLQDDKLMEIGLMESLEVGMAEYDSYIRNGMMVQLRRLKIGEQLEEDHMRNRQLVASWAYEKGLSENIIEKKTVEGKTYFVVTDYAKLRILFGELLREIQRIKSEGDFAAGQALVENYGVMVDPILHEEVLSRSAKLNSAPYSGFINPQVRAIETDGVIEDVVIDFPMDFMEQMLYYGTNYSFLPTAN